MPKLTYLEAQPLGDGVYKMELGRDQIVELETGRVPHMGGLRRGDLTPKPIYAIFSSIMSGRMEGGVGNPFASHAASADICNVVRLGLEGGGMESDKAARLVQDYSPPNRPLNELWDIAAALVYAHLNGVDEEAADA
jgi:hypothetical protein